MDISGPRLDDLSDGNIWPWREPDAEHERAEKMNHRFVNVNNITANAAAIGERQRGDTYRRRALALMQQVKMWRAVGRVSQAGAPAITEAVNLASEYRKKWIAENDRAGTWTARAAENGLRAEMLEGLLRKARLFVSYAQFSAGYQDANGKSQSYRSEDVLAEIDAALAAQPGEVKENVG